MASNDTWIIILVAAVVVVIVPFTFMIGGMGPWMMGSRMMVFWWPFMFLLPLAFVVLIALGVYYLFSGQRSSRGYGEGDALRILKERYARGEITSEQYEKMKKEIES